MKQETKIILKKFMPVFIIAAVTIVFAWGFASGAFQKAVSVFRGTADAPGGATTVNTDVELENVLPKDMHGVWLRAGEDFPQLEIKDGAAVNEEAVRAAIDEAFASFGGLYIDTLFVSAADAKTGGFDSLNYIFAAAKTKNLYCVLALPASFLMSDVDSLACSNEKIVQAVQSYRPDAVMLSGFDSLIFANPNEQTAAKLTAKIAELCNIIKTIAPGTLTGVSAAPVWAHKSEQEGGSDTAGTKQALKDFYADTRAWGQNDLMDFVYITPELTMADEKTSLAVVTEWWNETLRKSNAYAVLGIRTADAPETEFVEQLALLSQLQSFCGSVFDSYQGLLGNEQAKEKYLSHMSTAVAANPKAGQLNISRPTSKKTVTSESTISFMGTADPAYPLYCNGAEIPKSSLGLFSVALQLRAGENEFTFTHNGVSLTYTVTYKLDILTDVYPTGKTEAGGGTIIPLSALAYKEATVYAMVGKTKVELLPSEQNNFGQSAAPSDFVTFTGNFAMPVTSKKTDLGKISFFASFNGVEDSMTGGEITVLPELDPENIGNIIQNPTNYVSLYTEKNLPLKTAYQAHGLGTALMCEILKDFAETTPADAADDKSSPLYRPLLKGTFDYVTSIATYDDEMHYILASGRKVYAKDVKIIADGNKLPANNLSVQSSKTKDETEFVIKTDWLVPVSALLSPQNYSVGYQSRPFNVQSFSGQYLDLTFYYTAAATGSFNVRGSNVIESAKWINVGVNGTATLRIQLKTAGHFYGYAITLTDSGEYKITVKNRDASLKNKVIFLDAGHGGDDPGAIGVYSTIYESHQNLLIAKKVKVQLESMGAMVLMTREGDTNPSLNDRMLMARQRQPDAFVSIHHDASTSSVNSGTHTFYYTAYSMPLAQAIQSNMVNAYVKNQIVPKNSSEYAQIDQKIKFYPFAVTRLEECPSVLVECGYLTNAANANGLLTASNQDAIAAAIANGVKDYFKNN
ncbi:MAG: N-acetylmuramoyl-L-alanine amidase [Oscillospiraceae bacterium]|jgi:N-acetylmuramoyl-L-alanine amidase|nr:N-acetylmuramoyl-L-alanine amidase [Oscillospiraceae bacterium]